MRPKRLLWASLVALLGLAFLTWELPPRRSKLARLDSPMQPGAQQGVVRGDGRQAVNPSGPLPLAGSTGTHRTACRLRVQTIDGRPIEGASVSVLGDASPEPRAVGLTGPDGAIVLREAQLETVAVFAKGFSAREFRLPSPCPSAMDVSMLEAGTIAGSVIFSQYPDLSCNGAIVLAWPSDYRYGKTLSGPEALASDSRICSTKSDASGNFTLVGVLQGVDYDVVAWTPGWCSYPPTRTQASRETLSLELLWLMGVTIVIQPANGSNLNPGIRRYGRQPIDHAHWDEVKVVSLPSPIATLAGVDVPFNGSVESLSLLYACKKELGILGPITYRYAEPNNGVERTHIINAWPTDRGIQTHTIPCPEVGDLYDLALRFKRPGGPTPRVRRRGGIGSIRWGDYRLEFDSLDETNWGRVPRDAARGVVVLHDSGVLPSRAIVDEERKSITVSADASVIAQVEAEYVLPDGSLYSGFAALFLREPTAGPMDPIRGPIVFDEGPYILFKAPKQAWTVESAYPDALLVGARENAFRGKIDWAP